MEGTAGAQMAVSPKIQMVEYSQPVGPMRPEKKLTGDGLHICCGAHAMSYYTKKKRSATAPIFSNVTRAIEILFFELFKHHQLSPALHSTGNHEFWCYSRSRLVHNSSRTTGSNQNMLEIKKYGGKLMAMSIPVPKGLRE